MAASQNLTPYPQLSGPFSLRQQYMGQPAKMYASASQVIANDGSFHLCNLDTVSFDAFASSFNTSNHTFIAPASGYYAVKANVRLSGSLTAIAGSVFKNAGEVFRLARLAGLSGALLDLTQAGEDLVYLNSGDTLDLRVAVTGATCNAGGLGTVSHFISVQQIA